VARTSFRGGQLVVAKKNENRSLGDESYEGAAHREETGGQRERRKKKTMLSAKRGKMLHDSGEANHRGKNKSKSKAKPGGRKPSQAGKVANSEAAKERHARALSLNDRLQNLCRSKRASEALAVYEDPSNADIIDSHHAAILVNCCVRSGMLREAEGLVKKLEEGPDPVSVQAYTSMMKGYAHNGDTKSCVALLSKMCTTKRMRNV